MYDYFQGNLASVNPTQVTIDCQGVGYQLQVSLYTYSAVKDKKQVKLFAHLVVREDAHILFGFVDEEERFMFRELLNVNGVGATTARVMLSSMSTTGLKNAIAAGDAATLQKVKGIGAKTAQRIVIDLQDKMRKGASAPVNMPAGEHNTIREEALSALLTLGFARLNAEKALIQATKAQGQEARIEDLIKAALSFL
ncbi:Holliday junction branch migration protein RuvA [soil metagenome]